MSFAQSDTQLSISRTALSRISCDVDVAAMILIGQHMSHM